MIKPITYFIPVGSQRNPAVLRDKSSRNPHISRITTDESFSLVRSTENKLRRENVYCPFDHHRGKNKKYIINKTFIAVYK